MFEHVKGGAYELIDRSIEVPGFPAATAVSVITENICEDDIAVAKEFRKRT